jgi:hypothetical protein
MEELISALGQHCEKAIGSWITGKPETTALGTVIDCAENCSTGVLDVANAFNVRFRDQWPRECKPFL